MTLFVLLALVGQLTNIQTAFAANPVGNSSLTPSPAAEKCSAILSSPSDQGITANNFKDRANNRKVGTTLELNFEDPNDGLTHVREAYKQELKKIKWTSLLPNLPEVREQCAMNVCHAMVWLDYLEYEANKNGTGYGLQAKDYVSIDQDYLAMRQWERATEALIRAPQYPKGGKNNRRLADKKVKMNLQMGLPNSWKFIGKVGLVPEGIIHWQLPFKNSQNQERTNAVLENLAARVRLAAEAEALPRDQAAIFDQGVQAGKDYLHRAFGEAPQVFKHDGKMYDPVSFLRSVFPAYRADITMTHIFYQPELDGKDFGYHSNNADLNMKIFLFDQKYIESTIKSRIDKLKMPIPLDMHIHKAYLDKDNGVFTIRGWSHGENMKHPSRVEREKLGINLDGHAVLIVGYYENPATGRIEKLKIKNSWGKNSGENGYYIVDMDYFYQFIEHMTIPGDPLIPVPTLKPIPQT